MTFSRKFFKKSPLLMSTVASAVTGSLNTLFEYRFFCSMLGAVVQEGIYRRFCPAPGDKIRDSQVNRSKPDCPICKRGSEVKDPQYCRFMRM